MESKINLNLLLIHTYLPERETLPADYLHNICPTGYKEQPVFPERRLLETEDLLLLNKIQNVLNRHLLSPDFTTKNFCSLMGMPRMQLHKKIKAMTGLSTTAYIRAQRLKIAFHLLKTSELSIPEIAIITGFTSTSYFEKCFQKAYSRPPSRSC